MVRSRRKGWLGLSICVFVVALFVGVSVSSAQSVEDIFKMIGKNDTRMWKGEVVIKRLGKEELNESSKEMSYSKTRMVVDIATINVCGSAAKLNVSAAERTVIDKMFKNKVAKGGEILCPPPEEQMQGGVLKRLKDAKPNYGPGPSMEERETRTIQLYDGKDAPSVRETAGINLLIMGNKCVISGGSNALVTEASELYRKETQACTGKSTEETKKVVPGKYKERARIESSGSAGEKGGKTTTTTLPPFPLPLIFVKEIQLDSNSDRIEGDMVVSEIKPRKMGAYEEKVTAQWRLEAQDPCWDVYDHMLRDLAYAEAFLDNELQARASNIDQYKDLVDLKCWEIYHGRPYRPKKGEDEKAAGEEKKSGPDAEDNIYTDGNCEIQKKEEFKASLEKHCLPDVIYEATLKHEEYHVQQCEKFHKEYVSGDPTIYGLMEVSGYIIQIQAYIGWLEKNCPDYHDRVIKARQRVAEIQRIKLAR